MDSDVRSEIDSLKTKLRRALRLIADMERTIESMSSRLNEATNKADAACSALNDRSML